MSTTGISSLPLWGRAGVGAPRGLPHCPHPNPPPKGEGESQKS